MRLLAAVVLALCACSKGDGPPARGPDGGGAASCPALRACVYGCKGDAACAGRCRAAASADAARLEGEVAACTAKQCRPDDVGCRCAAECFVPAPCGDALDRCLEGHGDPFCDEECH